MPGFFLLTTPGWGRCFIIQTETRKRLPVKRVLKRSGNSERISRTGILDLNP